MAFLMILALWILGIVGISILFFKWNDIRYGSKGLPPGSMGCPILGESLKFLWKGPNFMKIQRKRYGNVFRTHILGSPTIISMDPELNRYILMNEAKGLVPGYPQSLMDLMGKNNISAVTGKFHKPIRGSALFLLGPSAVKERLLPTLDKEIRQFLQSWEDNSIIDIQEKTQEMAFLLAWKSVFEDEISSLLYKPMKEGFDEFVMGTISVPINLPGTNYNRGLQARENIIKLLKQVIKLRRESSRIDCHDMLDFLLSNEDTVNPYKLSDEEIHDLLVTILNSGYETESTTTMMAIKYLHHHPKAMEEFMDEQFRVRQGKSDDEPIEWLDYKKMSFTRAVVFETLRLATVVNGVFRKTTSDMELNGFHIPKGWRIYVCTREINYDPELYPEPFKFNPWRWMQDESLERHNYLFLFGRGSRLCVGKELGIATVSLFLHYFLTKFRWKEIGEQTINYFPRVQAPKGLAIRVMKR